MRTRNSLLGAGGLLLGAVLFVGINVLAERHLDSARIDLTEQRLYTLADGTRQLLAELEDPVTARLFLSRDALAALPALSTYAARVRELLREFERAADGNLELRVIDPEPFSEQEDRAVAYGLEGIPLGDGENVLYFGLVNSGPTDSEEIVPFLTPERERFLEYDLSKMIHQVSTPGRPVVGVLSGLPIMGGVAMAPIPGAGGGRWAVVDQIEQLFELRLLEAGDEPIPADLSALMVVHPEGLSERALYSVDQYVLSGGPALVFFDPLAESDPGGSLPGSVSPGGDAVRRLLNSWGLEMDAGAIVADINLAQRVRAVVGGRNAVVDYPVWMTLDGDLLDRKDVVTASLGQVALGTSGALAPISKDGIDVTPLMMTTRDATTVDRSRIGPGSDPARLVEGYAPRGEPIWLAARVTGRASTAWPDGPPAPDDVEQTGDAENSGVDKAAQHLERSQQDVNLIVVADTDLLRDEFWVTVQSLLGTRLLVPVANNDALVLNALENLSGSVALMGLRTRGDVSRPFTLIEDVRADAELRFRQKELELVAELTATEQRLAELKRREGADSAILDGQTLEELDRFRERKVEIRQQLRDVRRDLRADIEFIESWVRIINIGLVPLLVALGGMGFAAARGSRGAAR